MKISEPFFYTDLVSKLFSFLLVHPEQVRMEISESFTGPGLVLLIQSHATDQGLIIGGKGQTLNSLRTVVGIIALRAGLDITIKLLEPWTGEKVVTSRPGDDPDWIAGDKTQPITELLDYICRAMFADYTGKLNVTHDPRGGDGAPATQLNVTLGAKPPMSVTDAITTLFHAIGRAKGRNIEVHARVQTDQPPKQQCAAGRPEPGKVLGKVRSKPAR